jgi:hypothetical protein
VVAADPVRMPWCLVTGLSQTQLSRVSEHTRHPLNCVWINATADRVQDDNLIIDMGVVTPTDMIHPKQAVESINPTRSRLL